MKTSELIAKARKYLWDGEDDRDLDDPKKHKSEFICFALSNVQRFDLQKTQAPLLKIVCKTKDMIEARLFPWNNMDAWLQHGANIPYKDLTPDRVQAHRLAWMNLLIKEYKAKGD